MTASTTTGKVRHTVWESSIPRQQWILSFTADGGSVYQQVDLERWSGRRIATLARAEEVGVEWLRTRGYLLVRCPYCHSKPGQRCRTFSNVNTINGAIVAKVTEREQPHLSRSRLVGAEQTPAALWPEHGAWSR